MTKYLIEGGPLFMGILSLLLLIILILTVINAIRIRKNDGFESPVINRYLELIKSLGLFSLVTGMLGQFIGLFQAFNVIESGIDISPAMLAGGLKVSSITTIYGMIIFLIAYLVWFALRVYLQSTLRKDMADG